MGKSKSSKEPVIRVVGRSLLSFTISAAAATDDVSLNDQINTQLASLSDMYGLYRFSKLKLVLPPNWLGTAPANQTFTIYGIGFTPEPLLTLPSTIAETIQMPFWVGQTNTPSGAPYPYSTTHQKFSVPRKDLMKTGVKWFRTQGKGTESDWENQGTFVASISAVAVTNTVTITAWVEYECEFTDQLPLSVTRTRISARAQDPGVKKQAPGAAEKSPPSKSTCGAPGVGQCTCQNPH